MMEGKTAKVLDYINKNTGMSASNDAMKGDLESYGLIGDCETIALVSRNGSIDWLCWPRFDSPACFASLLGATSNGYWRIAPTGRAEVKRRYRPHTAILETVWSTAGGSVTVIDFMCVGGNCRRLIRIVRGDRGVVRMSMKLLFGLNYGRQSAALCHDRDSIVATGDSFRVRIRSSVPLRRQEARLSAAFNIESGEIISFEMEDLHPRKQTSDSLTALKKTERWWTQWASRTRYRGPRADVVERSLLTLHLLSYRRTGGIVAAPTTSLPEIVSGSHNWDYRYCWLRDGTFTLLGFMHTGHHEEAQKLVGWLLRAVGRKPERWRVLYDVTGKVTPAEKQISWLSGYQGACPVRVGNAAGRQRQLDIFGEVADSLYQTGAFQKHPKATFGLMVSLLKWLEANWRGPDHGIWEARKIKRQFTHSKVMCWVAFDRGIRAAEERGFAAPLKRWRRIRKEIHDTICREGFSERLQSFVRSFGSREVDASLLLLPLVGFLPANDARIVGTVRLIEKNLTQNDLVWRTQEMREGAFLPCTCWLADYYKLAGQPRRAMKLLNRLIKLRSDLGLLSEQYDPHGRKLMGNYPQALSHVALVNTIINLHRRFGPLHQRSQSKNSRPLL